MTETASALNCTFQSPEALARNVAEWLCGLAQASDGAFAVSLSGGSTPRRLYVSTTTVSDGEIRDCSCFLCQEN
jgi:6-phosphogluconolactonase/glucosamine-6-phosphate isomerase/deaminase